MGVGTSTTLHRYVFDYFAVKRQYPDLRSSVELTRFIASDINIVCFCCFPERTFSLLLFSLTFVLSDFAIVDPATI